MVIGKKCIVTGLLTLGIVSGMAGCQTEKNGDAGNVSSISGTSVSAEVSQADFWDRAYEELRHTERTSSHDDVVYSSEYNEENENDELTYSLVQRGADGSERKRFNIPDFHSIWGISDDWLYYETGNEDYTEDTLWRVPIQKSGEGEELLLDRKEKLVSKYVLFSGPVYLSDSSLIFEGLEDETDNWHKIYRYDLRTKKCETLVSGERRVGCALVSSDHNTMLEMFGDELFVETDETLCSVHTETGNVVQLMENKEDAFVSMTSCSGSLYLTTDHQQIYRYDGGGKEPVCVIGREVFQKKLESSAQGETVVYKDFCVKNIYACEDRLYFWVKKQTEDDIWGTLFSASVENPTELKTEQWYSDYMNQNWKVYDAEEMKDDDLNLEFPEEMEDDELNLEFPEEMKDDELNLEFPKEIPQAVYGPCRIAGIVDGKMVFSGVQIVPLDVSSVSFLLCTAYDLKTGEFMENPKVKIGLPKNKENKSD